MQAEWEELARRNWLTENEQAQIPSSVSPHEKVTTITKLQSACSEMCLDDTNVDIHSTVFCRESKAYLSRVVADHTEARQQKRVACKTIVFLWYGTPPLWCRTFF